MVTSPGLVASADCRTKLVPVMTAPLALLVWVSMVPIVLTPDPPVPVPKATQAAPFQMNEALLLGAIATPYMVKVWVLAATELT